MNVCDKAHLKVITGAESYTQAVKEAVEELADAGQMRVQYPSGHSDTIETAVLRCVRTGTAQASGNITMRGMEERDWDVILVSAHLGARYGDGGQNPGNHFWWQGKLYSRTGRTKELPDFLSSTGYGTGEGLCGWNCRHSFGPGTIGHNPYEGFDAEENKKAYDLSQKQRGMESSIRRSKTKLLGYRTAIDNCTDDEAKAALQAEYDKTALKLKNQNAAYNKFCEDNNLKRYDDRLHAARWNRSEAVRAAKSAQRSVQSPTGISARATEVEKPAPISISSAVQRVEATQEYVDSATPGNGEIYFDEGYSKADHADEISTAEWIKEHIGGDIQLLKESNTEGVKRPDYLWRGKLWDQKTSSTAKSANAAIRKGLKQIRENPGGVILDFNINKNDVQWDALLSVVDERMQWYRGEVPIDILIVPNGGTYRVVRYSKK